MIILMANMKIHSVNVVSFDAPPFCNPEVPNDGYKILAERIGSMEPGKLSLALGQMGCFSEVESPDANFTLVPEFAEGRGASRHGVYFGRLAVGSERHVPIEYHVAVKPYDKRRVVLGAKPPLAVAHDIATSAHLNRLFEGSAFIPLGVYREEGIYPVPSLITNYNSSVTSLDNVFNQTKEPSTRFSIQSMHALKLGNFALGLLHGAGISHNDAYPQNFAITGSQVVMNDTTSFRPFSLDSKKTKERVMTDITDFISGVFMPEVSSPEMRVYSASVLRHPAVLPTLYEAYERGLSTSVDRLGLAAPPAGAADITAHMQMIRNVADRYAAR